jgi:hypothetical protein
MVLFGESQISASAGCCTYPAGLAPRRHQRRLWPSPADALEDVAAAHSRWLHPAPWNAFFYSFFDWGCHWQASDLVGSALVSAFALFFASAFATLPRLRQAFPAELPQTVWRPCPTSMRLLQVCADLTASPYLDSRAERQSPSGVEGLGWGRGRGEVR